MSVKTRSELKNAFRKGEIPKEEDFHNLIDSFLHIDEDALYDKNDGWRLTPNGISDKMITFLNNISEKSSVWTLWKHNDNINNKYSLNLANYNGETAIYIDTNCNIGIGKANPENRLDINGNIAFNGRKGMFAYGKVVANGEWHKILTNLSDCHLFEVVAKMSKYHKGIHSILYAIAANAFNGKGRDIKTVDSYYDSENDKIELRWTGQTFNYNLEIRSKKNQGEEVFVNYNVTTLWW